MKRLVLNELHNTLTLHMLNHMKLLQSNVVRLKPNVSVQCVSINTNVYSLMCDPLENDIVYRALESSIEIT